MYEAGIVSLLGSLNVLFAIHMFFSRRSALEQQSLDRLLYAAKREEVELIRAQSAAIGWLTEKAKDDISSEANRTRERVGQVGNEIKQEIKTAKNGGNH